MNTLNRIEHLHALKPGAQLVEHKGEGIYRMCEMCAFHNVKNRRAVERGPYIKGVLYEQNP